MTFAVNVSNFSFGFLTANGTMIAAPNQPAERLTKNSEIITKNTGSMIFIQTTIL